MRNPRSKQTERDLKEAYKSAQGTHGVVYPKTTLWQRIRRVLFPVEICPKPTFDFENKDMLTTKTVCHCSIIPRLGFLFTGRLVVETRVATENAIGRHATASACYVATKGMADN